MSKSRMEFKSKFRTTWRDNKKLMEAADKIRTQLGWQEAPVRYKVLANGELDMTKTPGYDGFKF